MEWNTQTADAGFPRTGKILAICISEEKGTQKHSIPSAVLKEYWGIEGDAHAGKWHRQVSLLSFEKIEAFRAQGANVDFGAFGENLVVEGFDFRQLPLGTCFQIGEVFLRLTQIGKKCHSHCEIYKVMGDCIMPREGVFTEVLRGGVIHPGDEMRMLPPTDYALLKEQLSALLQGERDPVACLANASALLYQSLPELNWAGFYRLEEGALILGPFQGKPACIHISVGEGVCGTAVREGKSQRVADVHEFPGHIACDAASRSELVIPLYRGSEVAAVLDLDSPLFSRFSAEDQSGLEAFARQLEICLGWKER